MNPNQNINPDSNVPVAPPSQEAQIQQQPSKHILIKILVLAIIIAIPLISIATVITLSGKYGTKPKTNLQSQTPISTINNKLDSLLFLLYISHKQSEQDPSGYINKMYKSDINRKQETEVDFGYKPNTLNPAYSISFDGKFLAKITHKTISIASSSQINSFKPIVELTDKNEIIDGFAWSEDASRIAYIVKVFLPNEIQPTSAERKLYLINSNGTEKKLISLLDQVSSGLDLVPATFVSNFLIGLNISKNEAYVLMKQKTDDPLTELYNPTLVSLTENKVKEIKHSIAVSNERKSSYSLDHASFSITPDLSKFYYLDVANQSKRILEYNLQDNTKRIIYEIKEDKKYTFQIVAIFQLVPPTYESMLLNQISAVGSNNFSIDNYLVNNTTGQVEVIPNTALVSPAFASFDGNYIWMEGKEGPIGEKSEFINHYCMYEVRTKKIVPFSNCYNQDVESVIKNKTNEVIDFIGWISQ